MLCVTLVVTLLLFLSPWVSGISSNPCSPCHSSYYQYLDILEGNNANQVPAALNLSETKTVSIVIENKVNTNRYSTLSGVSVTLSSKNGHFSVNTPTYNIGDMPAGTKTAIWQITGISDGFDFLSIEVTGYNQHLSISFSDSYLPYPLITVGTATGIPPSPPAPAPSPSPSSSPSSTPTPESTPTPIPNTTPNPTSATPEPSNQDNLSILLLSPTQGEKWLPRTTQSIEWNASGGTNPLNITLAYSTSNSSRQWASIATDLPNNGSFPWTVPNTALMYYIRANVSDSAIPPQTASTTAKVEIVDTSPALPAIPIAAVVLTVIALVVVVLLKRRMK